MVSIHKKIEQIKVYVRFKPLKSENLKPIIYDLKNNENETQTLYLKNILTRNQENMEFKFDKIFPSTTSQSTIFEKVASPMVDKFVQKGINCTILSYGQTGSGKTYTICGLKQLNDRGIIHQTFGRLFDHLEASSPGEKYQIKVSFIEIYNDQIRDLSRPKNDSNVILFNTNIKRIDIKNESTAIKLFEKIKLKRKTSETNRNEHSSRSHLICTIHLTKYDHLLKIYDSEFNLVDLAGSERYDALLNKTAEFESRSVNESLYHLRQVTKKLADPHFKGNIPYRTSRLTWALENTLGRQCRVAMIANVDSHDKCIKESINTFEFATEIASIKKCIENTSTNTSKRAPAVDMSSRNRRENVDGIMYDDLITENALLKEQYDLLRKQYDRCERRTNKIFSLARKHLAELYTKVGGSAADLGEPAAADNVINATRDTAESYPESALPARAELLFVMLDYAQNDVPATESSSAAASVRPFTAAAAAATRSWNTVCRWSRRVFGKIVNVVSDCMCAGTVLGSAVPVSAIVGLGSVVTMVVGLRSMAAELDGLRNAIVEVTGQERAVVPDYGLENTIKAVYSFGTVTAVAWVVGYSSLAVLQRIRSRRVGIDDS